MKIAVCGTQCVGKSTLIDDMLAQMPEFKKPTFTYRDAIKNAGLTDKINRKTCTDSQRIIFNAVVKEIQESTPYTIHDRSVLDAVAYTEWPTRYDQEDTDISKSDVRKMKKAACEYMELYDLIIYIPIDESIDLKSDDLRDVNPEYRRQMAKIMDSLYLPVFESIQFDKYGYKVLTVSGSREERLTAIKEQINAIT